MKLTNGLFLLVTGMFLFNGLSQADPIERTIPFSQNIYHCNVNKNSEVILASVAVTNHTSKDVTVTIEHNLKFQTPPNGTYKTDKQTSAIVVRVGQSEHSQITSNVLYGCHGMATYFGTIKVKGEFNGQGVTAAGNLLVSEINKTDSSRRWVNKPFTILGNQSF